MAAAVWVSDQDLPINDVQLFFTAATATAILAIFFLLRYLASLRQDTLLRVAAGLALLAFVSLGCEAYIVFGTSRLHDDAGLILFLVSVPLSLISALFFIAYILAYILRRTAVRRHRGELGQACGAADAHPASGPRPYSEDDDVRSL